MHAESASEGERRCIARGHSDAHRADASADRARRTGDGKAERAARPQNLRGDARAGRGSPTEIEEHDEKALSSISSSSPACSGSSTTKSPPTAPAWRSPKP